MKNGWSQADRLHERFVQSVSLVYNYQYIPEAQQDAFVPSWPPYQTKTDGETCDELNELLNITLRIVDGMLLGLSTLTEQRDSIQATPALALKDAWPDVLVAKDEFEIPDALLSWQPRTADIVVEAVGNALDFVFDLIGFKPVLAYNTLYSIATVGKNSFQCPYEAVQSCSQWRVRLWQGFIIVTFWFSIASLVAGIFGLSFFSMFLLPLHSIVLLQLCYGYTWTCLPMLPICAWQDFAESFDAVFPLQLTVPDELKHTHAACIVRIPISSAGCAELGKSYGGVLAQQGGECLMLQRYPPPACLRTCMDPPFEYTSFTRVLAWYLAEIGEWASDWAKSNVGRVPFVDQDEFIADLDFRISELQRGKDSMVQAHRICAVVSSYMVLPYVIIVLVCIVYITTLTQLLGAQLYPFILAFASLFAAVSVQEAGGDEDEHDENVDGRAGRKDTVFAESDR